MARKGVIMLTSLISAGHYYGRSQVSCNLQQKMASDIIDGSSNNLIVNRQESRNSEEMCQTQASRHWLEFKDGNFQCFYIARLTVQNGWWAIARVADEVDEAFYDSRF